MTRFTPIAQGQERSNTAANSVLPFYRDHIAKGHYVILRMTYAGSWRYYPNSEELACGDRTYKLEDGVYQYARTAALTRKERQIEAEKLLFDIKTWHENVSCTGPCYCGKTARLTVDPYIQDLHDRTVYDYICPNCYAEAVQDI